MRDVYYELRTSYFSLISGNIIISGQPIPYYYSQIQIDSSNKSPANYILLNTIYSNNFNDDRGAWLNVTVQLMIVTRQLQNNSGAIADQIAAQLYSIISPYPAAQIVQIVNGYVLDTKMNLDTVQTGLNDGERKVVNRIISFGHIVDTSLGDTPQTGNIFYGVQNTNVDPTNFTNSFNQDASLPVSVDYGAYVQPLFYWLAIPSGYAVKGNWEDLNDNGNAGTIGGSTDLFEVRSMMINSTVYTLYMTRYLTGFNLPSSQVRYY